MPKRDTKYQPERTQHLREQDLNGKTYNIITHSKIEFWPPKSPERRDRRLSHPSQTSLRGPRNMQGAMGPATVFSR